MKATRRLGLFILVILTAVSARAVPIFGINNANNNLVRFDSATPGTIVSSVPITGMVGGENLIGIDFRPLDGRLFGLGSGSRLYVIDPITAVATQVGTTTFDVALSGTAFGFDFNPVVDRIRVVSDTEQNFRLDPNSGIVVDGDPATGGIQPDTNLAYAAGDPNFGQNPNVVGAAYTNSAADATTTTLFGIDSNLDVLVRQGGLNVPPGTPSPNGGQLFTVGPLGVNTSAVLGFDIANGSGTAFATMVVGGVPRIYTINLTTGAATVLGTIGPSTTIRAMAAPISSFGATLAGTTATFAGTVGGNSIVFDQSGGLLRHNRFSAGDSGFNSDFDFNSTTAGDQTLSATNPAVIILVNTGDRDDQVTIGTAAAPASALAATFQISGQGGGDSLTINDSASAVARSISINGASSTITNVGGPITYGTVERVDLFAGSSGDAISISGTTAAITSINTGGGSDTVTFANGASLSGGLLDGGAGTDTVDYAAYSSAVTVDLNETNNLLLALLSGMQEPGPLSSSQATGRGFFVVNSAQTDMTFNIAYSGLSGSPISGTHFHNQISGVNGPIVRGLFPAEQNGLVTPSGAFSGVWSNNDPILDPPASDAPIRPLNALSPVTAGSTLLQELLANRIYFNLHTLPNFPSGEIRGQVINQGAAGTATGTGGIRGVENATGGANTDTLTGNLNANTLRGGGGADVLIGGPGGDSLFGDAGDDLMIWNNGDGSDLMEGGTNNDTVQVNGHPTSDDQFLIQVNPADSSRLRFDRTNLGLFNLNIATTEILDFNPLGGNDTTTVEFAGGNPIPAGGIDLDGSTGNDALVLDRSAGSFAASFIIHTGTGFGAGTVNIDSRVVNYTGIEPIQDTVPATNFSFTAPSAAAQLQVVNGPTTLGGIVMTQINDGGSGGFGLLNFGRKTNVGINSGSVGQTILVNNSVAPTNLSMLTINGGPLGDDIDVITLPPGITAFVNGNGSTDDITVIGAGVPAGTTLFVDNGVGFDRFTYDSGGIGINRSAGPNPGQTTITRPSSGNVIYQNAEEVIFDGIARALNISTRLRVLTVDNALIGGFIIAGGGKNVIMRAIGPSLAQFGLQGVLADPTLELYDAGGQLSSVNDNWRDTQEAEINATGLAPQNDLESAIVTTLLSGPHTVVLRGKNNTTGIGVVEAYDLEAQSPAQFANISTRGFVNAGDNVMIGGFILGSDTGSTHVAVRGIGPSLAQVGLTNVLADPTLDLFDANGARLVLNDNWQDDPAQAAALTNAGLAPSNPAESAILTTLAPGAFTAILAGKNGGIGVGLVEVYNLQ